jgi:hypothetical protein
MIRSLSVSMFLCLFGAVVATAMAQEVPTERAAARAKAAPVALLKPEGLHADLPEMGASLTNLMLGGGGKPKAFYTLIGRLGDLADKAATTPVLIDLTGAPVMNLAQCTELGRALAELRKSRKVIAYLENAGLVELQIAAACDHVLMADMGMVDLRSLAMTVLFMKDALDLLGVQMDVIRCGDFKGAVEPFMQSSMSRHLREHYREMLASMNDDLVARIARGRKLEAEQVRALQGQRLLTRAAGQGGGTGGHPGAMGGGGQGPASAHRGLHTDLRRCHEGRRPKDRQSARHADRAVRAEAREGHRRRDDCGAAPVRRDRGRGQGAGRQHRVGGLSPRDRTAEDQCQGEGCGGAHQFTRWVGHCQRGRSCWH